MLAVGVQGTPLDRLAGLLAPVDDARLPLVTDVQFSSLMWGGQADHQGGEHVPPRGVSTCGLKKSPGLCPSSLIRVCFGVVRTWLLSRFLTVGNFHE